MKELLQYALEAIVSTGILYGCYRLLLDRRVGYGLCRLYLFAALVVGSLIPLFDIPVWPGRIVEVAPLPEQPLPLLPRRFEAPVSQPIDDRTIVWALYALGAFVLLALMTRQAVQIARLHRGAVVSHHARYRLVRTLRQISSFSFLRSIYLWQQTPEEELSAIIAHEASHIAHHHTTERLAIEVLKALLWWNPVAWLTTRSLAEVEEFEADHDVLRAGFRRDTYMTTIYRQLVGYSPDIANGLPHSLTKKRFEMMTTQIRKKGTLLRMAAVVPVMAGLVCAFSFTARATEYRTVGNAAVEARPAAETQPAVDMRSVVEARPAAEALRAAEPTQEQVGTLMLFVSAAGKPLAGALVTVQGTAHGTVTDAAGKATLRIPSGTTVEISYVGMKSETYTVRIDAAEAEKDWTVAAILSLEPETAIDEVVVAGYGAVARGAEAARSEQPLYVLDGKIISEEAFRRVDPNRVASIEVLKTEAAVRLYGEQAKNGVIVLTLKSAEPAANDIDKVIVTGFVAPAEAIESRSEASKTSDEEQPFVVAEVMPSFEGGNLNVFRNWVNERVRYPEGAIGRKRSGRVVASFVIDCEGNLTQIRILQSPDPLLSDEVIRVLSASPRWSPGEQQGTKVRVIYTMPVDFRVEAPASVPASESASAPAEEPATATAVPAAANGATAVEEDEPYTVVDRMPTFKGGDVTHFRNWIMSQIRYPEELRTRRIGGTVLASFVIDLKGRVTDIQVLQTPDRRLSEEVVGALRRSPRWVPAQQDGRIVRVRYTIPVQFTIR